MAESDESALEPDPVFEPSERLFLRVRGEDVVNGNVDDAALHSPIFSVNRGKYSAPEDVIAGHKNYRIAVFRVDSIPPSLLSDSGTIYTFGPEHKPEKFNYSHSEVCAYKDRAVENPPKHVRKKFRNLLRRGIAILE